MTRAISRRRVLQGLAGTAGAAFLAACGVSPQRTDRTAAPIGTPSGELSIATWPGYIDVDEETEKRPSLERFEQRSGIKVSYREVVDDNDPFFGTIRVPLSQGEPTGWDLIVVTDWLVNKMRRLGYLERLDPSRLPLVDEHLGPAFRDGTNLLRYSVPYQAGITGIGYNPELTKRKITSFTDLFDPAFEGKVGMLSDMRDMVHLTLLSMDIDPARARTEDVTAACNVLVEQRRKSGLVRAYYESDYTDALAKGDVALCLAYSGDVFQLQADHPHLEFVVPREGGMLWVDEMAVPKGAEHPADAHEWMNYVYAPDVAAQIAAWVQFIPPVPAAQGELREMAAAAESGEEREELEHVASSPLVFPTADMRRRLHRYRDLSENEERTWNDLFAPVVEG